MPRKKPQHHQLATLVTGQVAAGAKEPLGLPAEVAAIRHEIKSFLGRPDVNGRKIGNAKCGVYAFYDYDGEPIYIGQTFEGLGSRIGRHMTNQRTDAVAMNVLDPFEVSEIRVWPIEPFASFTKEQIKAQLDTIKAELDRAEYTLFVKVIEESSFKAVLNEKPLVKTKLTTLPVCYAGKIIPESIFHHRKHPDVRIARRASTIASLARVISERRVSQGLRQTLLTQARRLERLAAERLADFPKDDSGDDEG